MICVLLWHPTSCQVLCWSYKLCERLILCMRALSTLYVQQSVDDNRCYRNENFQGKSGTLNQEDKVCWVRTLAVADSHGCVVEVPLAFGSDSCGRLRGRIPYFRTVATHAVHQCLSCFDATEVVPVDRFVEGGFGIVTKMQVWVLWDCTTSMPQWSGRYYWLTFSRKDRIFYHENLLLFVLYFQLLKVCRALVGLFFEQLEITYSRYRLYGPLIYGHIGYLVNFTMVPISLY